MRERKSRTSLVVALASVLSMPGFSPAAAPTLPADAKILKVTSREFYDDWHNDKSAASKKYAGAWTEFKGKVNWLGKAKNGDDKSAMRILLEVDPKPGEQFSYNSIECFITEPEPWTKIAWGGTVTLRGTADEEGQLQQCKIVGAEGKVLSIITSQELAKQFRDGKSFNTRSLLVSGEVKKVFKPEESSFNIRSAVILLKGDGDVDLPVHATTDTIDLLRSLKPGDKVLIYGKGETYTDDSTNKPGLGLNSSTLLLRPK